MRQGRNRRWSLLVSAAVVASGVARSARTDSIPQPAQNLDRFGESKERQSPATNVPGLAPLPGAATSTATGSSTPVGGELVPGARIADEPELHGVQINLATGLELAGVKPLDIAAATAQVQQGLALLLQAQVLWVPTINGGIDYSRHDGFQQNIFTGGLFQKGRQSFFTGGGPSLNVGVTDAIYEPLAAHRVVNARRANLQAARNDVLLAVAQAFFALQDARGRKVGADATIVRARKLVNLAEGLSPGLIAPLEINRSRAELQSLLQTREVAIRDWRVASAQLAEILLLDPEILLEPIEPPFVQVELIPRTEDMFELVSVALNNRPEITSQQELLAAANFRLKEEKKRPFLPNLLVLSPTTATGLLAAGNFAGGPNGFMNENGHSASFEVAAVWQLQNGGVGNIGRIRQRRAEQDLAAIDVTRVLYHVRSDVSQAVARLQTARARVPQTEVGLVQATESADKNFIGLRETTRPAGELLRLVIRPQEVVAALIALYSAYEEYANAVNEFNAAQFTLYHALGQPAQWVSSHAAHVPLNPAGSVPAIPANAGVNRAPPAANSNPPAPR
jgi:outer membrane protein TolC